MGFRRISLFFRALRASSSTIRYKHYASGLPIKKLLVADLQSQLSVKTQGWVKTFRVHRDVVFLALNDGSCRNHLQVIVPAAKFPSEVSFGACVEVEGQLVPSPNPQRQKVEVQADSISVLGSCDSAEYPFKLRKDHPVDYARQLLHLRPQTDWFSSLLRVRNVASLAIHEYFQTEGFCQIHTPILTSNDCEGAGEVFQVEPADKGLVKELDGTDSKHFFNVPTFLTVSGQLHLEAVAGAISRVYTFGPTFRAENSQSRHHLSEFYMVEGELAFIKTLEELLQVIEGLVKHTCKVVLESCEQDLDLHLKRPSLNNHKDMLDRLIIKPFHRITYTEAVRILEKQQDKFTFKVEWGCDLHKEHERHLVAHFGNIPVFVTDYPAELKPFYMKANENTETVAAVDLLAPDVGEVVGGSLREDDLQVLTAKLEKLGLKENYEWYLDLRRFGSAPHGGFGLGFERLLQIILGIGNIKDTIPFPRFTHHCKL